MHTKQPGRRYGPPPKKPRGPGAGPMSTVIRVTGYLDQNDLAGNLGGLTARQLRQVQRMAERHGYQARPDDHKGRATPKRGAR